jgi:hypothetical protein
MEPQRRSERRNRTLRALPQIEPGTFGEWLRHHTRHAKTLLGATVAIPGLTLLFGLVGRHFIPQAKPHIESITVAVLLIQFIVVFCLYWFIPRNPEVHSAAGAAEGQILPRAARAARRFGDYWGHAWLCWALVYFGLGLSLQYRLWYPSATLWLKDPLNHALNNIQTIFFLMCYRELRYPTDEEKRNPLVALLSIPLFVMAIEALLLAPDNPVHDTVGTPLSSVLGWTSGFIGGAAIALLVGRLESKLIDPPLWLTILLYLYAAIQGAHPLLTVDLYATLILASFAFFAKIVFFLFVAWILQSGVILYYFAEVRKLDEDVPKERRAFLSRLHG